MSRLVIASIECVDSQENYGRFVCAPLERGFGVTLGNVLRRVLLGHLPGAAVTHVQMGPILHEFSTIPDVKEDTIEFLLNIKSLRLKALNKRPGKLNLRKEGAGEVYASDITPSADFEIINPDLYLATVNGAEAVFEVEFDVGLGEGYRPAESSDGLPVGTIPVDAVFTPVHKVNFNVKPIRTGEDITRDQLEIEVWTNGSITPTNAISESARTVMDQLNPFLEYPQTSRMKTEEEQRRLQIPDEKYNMPVEQLDLSVRTMNCLRRAGITTVGELIGKGEKELLSLRNFGLKSKVELQERLETIGLTLTPADEDEEDAEGVASEETEEPEEGDDTAAAMDQVETEEDIEAEVEAEAEGA